MSQHKSSSWTLALLALGVVYGDIGTSPLYALRECLHGRYEAGNALTVLGPVSLMIWSLTIIVMIKYLFLLSKADNQGEGGIFALYSLLRQQKAGLSKRAVSVLSLIALVGAALLYGDGIITPAISVLAAVEGIERVSPGLPHWVIPVIAACILLGLFLVQRHGTGRIGGSFGPVMLIWFSTLAALGLWHLLRDPSVLRAFSPHYGVQYLWYEGGQAFHIMGTVLLAVTGCEALYADIGHFGREAMKRSWIYVAYPALVLNYLGQGALLLNNPKAAEHPFYSMVEGNLLIPLVILATMATIIASQAMITGVFSLTQQAVQLGFVPRLKIVHTSTDVRGQIYMPQINTLLCVACLGLVLYFKESSALASAYGLSVASDMVLSSILLFMVMTRLWKWETWKAAIPIALFLLLESGYWLGSIFKLFHGAWIPLIITGLLWMLMKTWRDGRAILIKRVTRSLVPVVHLVDEIKRGKILRVQGIGVFMSSSGDGLPLVLLHHLKHNKVLHETAVLLTVKFEEAPFVDPERRVEVVDLHESFFRVILHYGYSESPEVMRDMCRALKDRGITKLNDMSFYQSRELLLTDGNGRMATWRKKLFVFLSRVARPATGYFQLPSRQVIELGIQLEL
ncbi:KUP/HAK/KT family potassium transporter [Verrucomicrobium sp. BvORR034]|uniref:potassium transporter Kup n=1 Tax=Verrucomicrobium sp. BvORR034 TaxID=1396418 RepID=UPI0007C824CE|nr:KUP/HAK/KT family potassium transporter [Verrucomicrobium sp. BvORR034]